MKRLILVNIILSLSLSAATLSIFSCIKICTQERAQKIFDSNRSLIFVEDDHRDTPLHYAVRYKKYKLIYYLVRHGADVSKIGANHLTPVDIAIENNDEVAMKFLMLSPTFNRAKRSKRVKEYLKENAEEFDDIANEDFLDSKSDFQTQMKVFTNKVRQKSLKKRSNNYMHSQYRHDEKSVNKGNVEIYIK